MRTTGLRVVLITRRFWPLNDEVETTLAGLATGLRRRGAAVTVLTMRGTEDWPARIDYQGVPVWRLPDPHRDRGRTWWYLLGLARWLRREAGRIDVACVSRLRFDAYAALRALRPAGVPVVLRAETAGPGGDCQGQSRVPCGGRLRRRCQTADALIAPDALVEEELIAQGYAGSRLVRIANAVPAGPPQTAERRSQARADLAEANPELAVAADAPVVVYRGRWDRDSGLRDLLLAWRQVVRRWSSARLWLLGDGPGSDPLRHLLSDLELRPYVVLPGVFETLGGVLPAARLYVDPRDAPGLPAPLLEAMAAGVPVLTTQPRARWLPAGCESAAARTTARDTAAWGEALMRVLAAPPRAEVLAERRLHVLRQFSWNRMVEEHLQLFQRLAAAASRPGQPAAGHA